MKKHAFLVLTTALVALAWSQPAAAKLNIVNGTDKPALFTVTYYTKLCKDDRGVSVAPKATVTLKNLGGCTVNTVYASLTMSPGFANTCLPKKRTGSETYTVTVSKDGKDCNVN
jgi:hypothetical protein